MNGSPRLVGIVVRWLLLPLAWLYEAVLLLRNALYDRGILRSHDYTAYPIVCVGNLTVGGTGKTPHTEYLVQSIGKRWKTAVVSRGYRRKTSGMVHATLEMNADDIGDEPWQMFHKFPNMEMVVSANRHEAIQHLLEAPETERVQAVVLDDAYQHRKVKAGLNILLTDYNRLMCDDVMLPAGRLREPFSGRKRAQVVIVTKCRGEISDQERQSIRRRLKLTERQMLCFTRQKYQAVKKLFQECDDGRTLSGVKELLLITGIATPQSLQRDLIDKGYKVKMLPFPDHHRFTSSDLERINRTYAEMKQENSLVLTTEKDAARLMQCSGLSEAVRCALHVLPLEVEFIEGEQMFNQYIRNYVEKNQGNMRMAARTFG